MYQDKQNNTNQIKDGMGAFSLATKRILDIIGASILLILSSPIIALISILIKLQKNGPVIFRQTRIGYKGKPFTIYKFRTLNVKVEANGPQLISKATERFSTPLEIFIRSRHLDELPQLWNVLKGDLSFVGPRPERRYFIDQIISQGYDYSPIFLMRPGLTSKATIYNGYTDTFEKMIIRLNMDIDYYHERTIIKDIAIVCKTIPHIFSEKYKKFQKMKRIIFILIIILSSTIDIMAQSSMTDKQVMEFVVKEMKKGTSQSQIVTQLIQKGVDIQQIRRVKKQYERVSQDTGLGQVGHQANDWKDNENRLRENNSDKHQSGKIKDINNKNSNNNQERKINDDEFKAYKNEIKAFEIDSLKEDTLNIKPVKSTEKVFGRDIFNNKNLSFEPNMNIATPQNYRLGPGDAVFIDVYGASQKTEQITVSPDGDINIPGYGPIQVSGMTIEEANYKLKQTLGTRYNSSKVRLTLGQTKSIMINVMGEVSAPGTYTLSAFATVFHALYMAGGTNDIGTLRNIKVYRKNKLVSEVDIYDYILNGKLKGNVRLADNDVIVVGPYDNMVKITGKVKRPMFYEMKKEESLATLINYAGGFTGDAYTKNVKLIRKTGKELSIHTVSEFDMSDFQLSDQDSVVVDSIIQRFANMVEIKGAVFRPGKYEVGKNINSVKTLIQHAEGLTEEAFTARSILHRFKSDRTLQVIPVDIENILKGSIPDLPLKENDVLFIPTKQELMQQQTVTIHGEVHYPGIYKFADNETLEDFILQAGGLKETASTIKVDVARRIKNPKAIAKDSIIAQTFSFALKDGFVIDGQPGFVLKPYDEVYVRKSPGYSAQQNIEVRGQVLFEGTYTLKHKSERLSDAIKKAGGLTDLAYIKGARLERTITPYERLRMETLLKTLPIHTGANDTVDIKKLDIGDTYYVGIELEKALKKPGGDEDIVLREGDKIIIPEYNGTVKISGNVMYPNTVAYEKGKTVNWYINQAGGFAHRAKKSRTYVIHMNGKVSKVNYNTKVTPGCEIVVPGKPENKGLKVAEWMTIGTSVASIATMIATMVNLLR